MKTEEEPVYVGIEKPIEVRRAILESSKNLIKLLQKGERVRENKKHKQELILQVKEIQKEIMKLVAQLKSQMPKVRISSLPKRHAAKPIVNDKEENKAAKQAIRQLAPPKPKPAPLTESQKLEKELQDIEDKLKML